MRCVCDLRILATRWTQTERMRMFELGASDGTRYRNYEDTETGLHTSACCIQSLISCRLAHGIVEDHQFYFCEVAGCVQRAANK